MSRLLVLATILIAGAISIQPAEPYQGFVVVVNKANKLDSVPVAMLRVIYLRKVSRWPWGAEIAPIDMATGSTQRVEFTRKVLETSPEQLAVYWIDQFVTRSVKPPKEIDSLSSIKALVAARPGAIAYIPPAAVDGSVKTVVVRW